MCALASLKSLGGVGLKAQHYEDIVASKPALGFFEVHAENYMGDGGPPHRYLSTIRQDYPLSLHGVGLSIGGQKPLDLVHLARLRELATRYEPFLFSEHLAWSTHDQGYLGDLLPLPYTNETLTRVCDHIHQTQDALGRIMLLENPSSYLTFDESTYDEAGFIAEVGRRTGCELLLDVNNVFISAHNINIDAQTYINAYPMHLVREIHLAGHTNTTDSLGAAVLIDDHAAPVLDAVWALYEYVIEKTGALPTLIERDNNIPPLVDLIAEAQRAEKIMRSWQRRQS